jgi:hypothetical protein
MSEVPVDESDVPAAEIAAADIGRIEVPVAPDLFDDIAEAEADDVGPTLEGRPGDTVEEGEGTHARGLLGPRKVSRRTADDG